MGNYIVSARKYRPDTFDSVVGQRTLTTTLKNAVSQGKLAHAYLFCGPRGVGKTTCARIFAKTINCEHPTATGEACNECESCTAFNEQRSMNIHELDAASNNSVEDIRGLIDQVQIPPQVGRFKVFIIDEVHMLSTAAFNAFLKTLEEPPAHAVFILATTEKHKILPTILSRCQIYDFARMTVEDTVRHLQYVAEKEGYTCEPEALHVIAEKADGGMRDALSIFDQVAGFCNGQITYRKVIEDLNVLDYEEYFAVTDALLKPDIPAALVRLNSILEHGFEANYFIGGLASHFRNLLMCRDEQTLPLLDVSASARERYREQARRCQPKFLYRALKLCNDCDINYRTARNKRLLVELTLIQTAQAAAGDDDSCGRRPARRLQPIFQPVAAQAAATGAAEAKQAAASPSVSASPENPSSAATPVSGSTGASSSSAAVVHPQQGASPSLADRLAASAARQQGRRVPLRTFSIRDAREAYHNTGKEDEGRIPGDPNALPDGGQGGNVSQGRNRHFDIDRLMYYWFRYAQQLPKERAATAGRMKNMAPKVMENHVVEVPVENEMVEQYMIRERVALETFLRDNLQNDHITLRFVVREGAAARPVRTRKEMFVDMLRNNSALEMLRQELGLELA